MEAISEAGLVGELLAGRARSAGSDQQGLNVAEGQRSKVSYGL